MNSPVVVDTNVPLVAKGVSHASDDCLERCLDALEDVLRGERRVVLDSGDRILEEYMHELSLSGQPTPGDAFLKWVFSNQAVEGRVDKVDLTPISEQEQRFAEFPPTAELAELDRSDRKFVAVAYAHPERPPILQATDSKWFGWRDALWQAGVPVDLLCEDDLRASYLKKFPPRKPERAAPPRRRRR
ncbi:MAG TPA: hypothetical protein VLS89_11845 [Candidatus Nanopelagicales bacterium]|nr:hypothetical protein [Candidatus Nanopelagicales bacterium]